MSSHRLTRYAEQLERRDLLAVTSAFPTFIISHVHHRDVPGGDGYAPEQLRTAYGINNIVFGTAAGDGSGQTIAIVDAYNDPTVVSDLDTFDKNVYTSDSNKTSGNTIYKQYGAASSFFTVYDQNGNKIDPATETTVPDASAFGWAVEISLDVQWAHAIAPGAKIDLIECQSNGGSDLYTGVVTAGTLSGVSAVSMSWGGGEFSGETSYDSDFVQSGVTFLASTGDNGSPGGYPAYSPNVVAVGGTTLNLNSDDTYKSESGWSGSGGGSSSYETNPAYQSAVQTTGTRTIPDIALAADPGTTTSNTSAAVYDSYDYGGWVGIGGTSWACPSWAGLVAIANQGRVAAGGSTLNTGSATQTQTFLYQLPSSDFHDNLGGSNGTSTTGLTNTAIYDEVTGLGSAVANTLVPDLANMGLVKAALSGSTLQVTGAGAATIELKPGDATTLEVLNGTSVAGSFSVAAVSKITVNLGSGSQLTVDASQGDPVPSGGLSFEGGPSNRLIVNYAADTANRTITLDSTTPSGDTSFGTIAGMAAGTISYEYADTSSVSLTTGTGSDTINALSTGTAISVSGSAAATFNVGSAGSVQNIKGALTIDDPGGAATITVDDSADTTARTATLSTFTPGGDTAFASITGLAPAAINYEGTDAAAPVTIKGGSGGNTFTVSGTTSAAVVLKCGTGNGVVNVKATTGSLTINGQGGTDTVNVGSLAPTTSGGIVGNIAGALTIGNVGGTTTLVVDDSGDAGSPTTTLTSSQLTGLAPANINYTAGQVTALTVNGGSGKDVFDFTSTTGTLAVTLNAGSGANTINITPSSENFNNIAGALTVNGGGKSSLTVDDQNDANNDTFTVTNGGIQRTGSALINYSSLAALTVNGGSGNVTYNVNSTAKGMAASLVVGSGNNTINLAPSTDSLSNVAGNVSVTGGSGTNTVNLDDQSAAATETFTVTSSAITRSGFGGLSYSSVQDLTVNGGNHKNTFNVKSTAAASPVALNSGTGGGVYNVGNANVLDDILGTLTVNGQGGTTQSLNVNDQSTTAAETYSLSASSVGRTGTASIAYSGLKTIVVNGGKGADSCTVSQVPAITVTLNGGSGTNTLTGPNATNNWSVTSVNGGTLDTKVRYTKMQDLVGGSGVDFFKISTAGKETSINGGGAPANQGDWLDYSSFSTTAVTVNLATGSATNINGGAAGAVTNIQDVHGGNGGNTLTGDAAGNILIGGTGVDTITGGTGRSLLIGDKGAEKVTGGSGSSSSGGDILIGGYTTIDSDTNAHFISLMAILAEWQSADSYSTRISDIKNGGGLNGTNTLVWNTSVKADGAANTLKGGTDVVDWFFANQAAGHDTIVNYQPGEQIN